MKSLKLIDRKLAYKAHRVEVYEDTMQKPDGEMPQAPNGEPPQKPDGEMPQAPNGEPPQKPDGEPPQ